VSGERDLVVALAGNPNAGKTSLFNKLTGLHAHVGNWPGVTVDRKWGQFTHRGRNIKLVDLPGIYSLNSYSLDERLARDLILNEKPDLVLDVIDATNLERNLYLPLQFLEMGLPIVLALNMMDMAEAAGLEINVEKIEKTLGAKVVPVVATTGAGLALLLDRVLETADQPDKTWRPLEISYGQDIDEALDQAQALIADSPPEGGFFPPRWLALKYLEGDPDISDHLIRAAPDLIPLLSPIRERLAAHLRATIDDDIAAGLTDHRYGFLAGLKRAAVTRGRRDTRWLSDALDRVLLNRLFAPVFFLAVIYTLYQFTFWASGPVVSGLESLFGALGGLAEAGLEKGLMKDLVREGLIGGVGAVLGFAPLIAFMFIGISVLEDSGYMARVAFILDRLFRAFGLNGNSAMALIVGGGIAGGCAIPGVLAARTLRDPKERIATILVTPMMTCGAKLPVFLLLTGAFFVEHQALIMLGLTVLAWTVALVSAKLLRLFILPGEPAPFVLELPPYRLPTVSGVLIHAWERTWDYIKRAGTFIVAATVIIWLLMTFPQPPAERAAEWAALGESPARAEALQYSLAGRLGRALEPLSRPAGFEWRTNIALLGGFAAKEVVLSTLGTAYAMSAAPAGTGLSGEKPDEEAFLIEHLGRALARDPAFSPLAGASLMVFVLLYAPCFATLAVIRREIGLRWAAFALGANTAYAYTICLVIFQGGRALGF
jgi:ferrous iron transport protein B